MEGDFIKVKKSQEGKNYFLEVYFATVNSTIQIEMNEADFLQLILNAGSLYNTNTTSFKLQFTENDITDLITQKRKSEIIDFINTLKVSETKPEAEVIIYIPDEFVSLNDSEYITNACGEFMEALGFELQTEDEPVFGSFFKKLKFIFSSTIGEEDLINLYERGKKALELKHIELPTADQTEKLATAAEKLVKSLDAVDEGVIRCGGLIVVKKNIDNKPKIIIQQLSTEMILILDKHPKLIFNPTTMYELLTGDVKTNIDDSDTKAILIA